MAKDDFSTKIISLLIPLTLITVVMSLYVKDQKALRATYAAQTQHTVLGRPSVGVADQLRERAWVVIAEVVFSPLISMGKAVKQIPSVPEALGLFALVPLWFFLLAGMFIYDAWWARVLCGYLLVGSFVVPLLFFFDVP